MCFYQYSGFYKIVQGITVDRAKKKKELPEGNSDFLLFRLATGAAVVTATVVLAGTDAITVIAATEEKQKDNP